MFWNIYLDSSLEVNRNLPPASALVSWLAYFPFLNIEAKYLPETLVVFQQTTFHYIPED
jgi:hypothetical protein